MPEKISRILLVRMDRLGDFVFSLPVIDNLKLAYPHAQLDILVRPYLKDFAVLAKNIDRVVVYDNFLSVISATRKAKYDIAIDMLYDYTLKTAVLTFFSGAPIRAGFNRGFRGVLFTHTVAYQKENKKSMVELNLELLKALDIPLEITQPRIEPPDVKNARQNIVVMHPGGTFPSQRWGVDKFVALGRRVLTAFNAKLIVIGSSGEEGLVTEIVSGMHNLNAEVMFPNTHELVSLLSRGRIFIGNNSGLLHLAAALGVATVSTMGPTDPILWWPQGENHIVIRKGLPCSPCGKARCRKHECMKLITVSEVMQAVEKTVESFNTNYHE
jgi:ADP-heptose:LPS heptosyltransferase